MKCLLAPQTQFTSQASVPYAIPAFRSLPTSLLECPSFRVRVQLCPCLVSEDRIPCVVQERRGRSTVLGRLPTSAGTHHRPGSFSSAVGGALRPDTSPRIGRQRPDRLPKRRSFRVRKVRRYDRHVHWGWPFPLQTGLRRFLAGRRLFSLGLHFF
jgi:hypothetical protein